MATPYESTGIDTTEIVYSGPQIVAFPLVERGDPTHKEVTQIYYIRPGSYSAPTLNESISVGGTTCYLVGDSPLSEEDTGLVSFVRTWMSIPATTYDYTTIAASFPGLGYGTGEIPRAGFTKTVPCQLEEDYFLVGTALEYETAGEIPQVNPTEYKYPYDTVGRDPLDIFLIDLTTPTAADYIALIGEPTWDLIVEPSELEQIRGNLWKRTTKRVRAL